MITVQFELKQDVPGLDQLRFAQVKISIVFDYDYFEVSHAEFVLFILEL